jgi:flavin-dependent dehydrogenase
LVLLTHCPEGIQYGMDAGKIAAQELLEALYIDDLSETRLKRYQDRWNQRFAWDFFFSEQITQKIVQYPIIMDAAVAVIRRRGADFVTSWALVRPLL